MAPQGRRTPLARDLASKEIPNCRVFTFGYDAYVTDFKVVSTTTVEDHGNSLIRSLGNVREGDGTNDQPIIFIAHSLGGIVCKDVSTIQKSISRPSLIVCLWKTPVSEGYYYPAWAG
ncbi:hypothetical protein B0H67DRAFT_380632 [Lasiosphaeris hirsuta]|uniref:DUF676 domain-containing protein n=1 Tax=Lasiosphaeris hirsuta TaxID=260670 RepID=A0AA39ZXA0_9PEZI|nr:hypothetical protein B0H67DRAFT_380632 [Lasiosphaeris hirsuta]